MERKIPPKPKYPKDNIEWTNMRGVIGRFVELPIKSLNSKVDPDYKMIWSEKIPIIETIEMEYKAGCFAKTKTPTPKMVVKTESIMEVL